VYGFANIPPECQGGIVSIGNFDGVHVGHQRLVVALCRLAQSQRVPAIAFTFDPPPVALLRPDQTPGPLTWTERKADLLHSYGVDHVVVTHTSPELLRLTAEEFFARVIRSALQTQGLVEGPDFGFGRGRAGTIATLKQLCGGCGLKLDVVDPVVIDGTVVSSSRIRQCLLAGQVELAGRLLGRPHRIRGRVGTGMGRGAPLGFPTANLQGVDTCLPADGVYAGQARVAGRSWPVAANIGANPTFGEHERKVEAHLVGFAGSLTGEMLELDLLARLRDTRKFASPSDLVHQLQQDVQHVAAIVRKHWSTTD
jgi:riboflavin kinase/FMN adenylyltransferase